MLHTSALELWSQHRAYRRVGAASERPRGPASQAPNTDSDTNMHILEIGAEQVNTYNFMVLPTYCSYKCQ